MNKRQNGHANRLSSIYGFDPKGIDFVDVDLDDDLSLYVDPLLMWRSPHREHHIAHSKIIHFFTEAIELVKAGKTTQAKKRFVFHEPENLLGVSSSGHRGHGMGQVLGEKVFNGIISNPDIMNNGMEFINELQLVIEDVGPDLISDMTVGITKEFFIDYTQTMCKKMNIPLENTTTEVFLHDEEMWEHIPVQLPRIPDTENFFILTPKILVRKSDVALNYKEVYREHLRDMYKLQYLNQFQGLAKPPKVFWKDVYKHYPVAKATVLETITEKPDFRRKASESVERDIQGRGVEITASNLKDLESQGQASALALKDILLALEKDSLLKREIQALLTSNPNNTLFFIDDMHEVIGKAGQELVVVLGSYNPQQNDPFLEATNFLKQEDYEPCIIKDMPDLHKVNPRQKLFVYAVLSRFLIVFDFGPSGHLNELELLKDLAKPVIIISQDAKGASYMTSGLELTNNFYRRFTLDEFGSLEDCLSQGMDWANKLISELQKRNQEALPWLK